MEGLVVKGHGGFYYVRDDGGREWICRPRGKLRRGDPPVVGDRVRFDAAAAVIEAISPRVNCLLRPPVANVDQIILVASLHRPAPDWTLINRQLVLAEHAGVRGVLCLNKTDLVEAGELERVKRLLDPFPYPVVFTSALSSAGVDRLGDLLKDRLNVFAGPSGVGKSTLINALQPDLSLQTGDVSEKINRGRHTTRVAELLFLAGGGMAVDTPGFSRLELKKIPAQNLVAYFPEMCAVAEGCVFRDCLHLSEPGCSVRESVRAGTINALRYDHYRQFFNELAEQEKHNYD